MLATAAVVVAQFLTLPWWGRSCDRFGNREILKLTGWLLPLLPLLWLSTTNVYGIIAIQLLAGASWGGFALAMGNFLFDNVKPAKRAQCVAVYHSANATGIFLGASFGGLLVLVLPQTLHVGGVRFSMASNLQWLFVISAVLRFAVSLKFLPLLRESRAVAPLPVKELTTRWLVVGWHTSTRMVGTLGRAASVVALVLVGQKRQSRK